MENREPLLSIPSSNEGEDRPIDKWTADTLRIFDRGTASKRFRRQAVLIGTILATLTVLNAVVLLANIANSQAFWLGSGSRVDPQSYLQEIFSPLDIGNTRPTLIDGKLFTLNQTSAWHQILGPPSSKVDAAWDRLSAEGHELIMISSHALKSAGYDPEDYFASPSDWGPEYEGLYPVQIDVFHQIHCLDMLRKNLYMNAQYYHNNNTSNRSSKSFRANHLGHCLFVLLQNIMCHADVDLIPHRWVQKDPMPFAQFGIMKQCRNFEALRLWNTGNSKIVTNQMWRDATRPKDAVIWDGMGEDEGSTLSGLF